MKLRKFLSYMTVIMLMASISSCEEYLDYVPDDEVTEDVVFTNFQSVQQYLGQCYFAMHNYVAHPTDWDSEIGSLSDESQSASFTGPIPTVYNKGVWLDGNRAEFGFEYNEDRVQRIDMTPAGEAVVGIRVANLALQEGLDQIEDVPQLPGGISKEQIIQYMEGEFRILRAWYHFELIRRYGGLFIIDEPISPDSPFTPERISYSECTEWIVSELDSCYKLLPVRWESDFEGRATKTSALAIKTMVLLYAASPNMNFADNGDDSYNLDYCKRAAKSAAETIQEANASGYYSMYPWSEYTENWYSETALLSTEAVWAPSIGNNNRPGAANVGDGWLDPPGVMGGWGNFVSPTQNAVDWFEHVEGGEAKAIEDHPSYNDQDPYVNRDPRFYQHIYHHGESILVTDPGVTLDAVNGSDQYLKHSANGVWTGYVHKKHNWHGSNNTDGVAGRNRYFPFIRLAQVYLDLAEAANEAYGPNGDPDGLGWTAVAAINEVRRRVDGLPDVHTDYTSSTEVFRDRIRNERAVELYHEMHRWHDIRRWRIAKEALSKIYRLDLVDNGGILVFGKAEVEGARIFEDKHYWYPLPNTELQNNPNLVQNPGW
ncbi:RagB/SusD family nutrient uptake outer membrane protein [Reichenbachiella versicolor]|uniref:RagB/SusD family nutrient uptake outer membrane protein n=1 Tax=Reichenbachiella versicolor TaxID=1821036 RepID=UPI000D6EAFA6|nr:RagB/SusD family nutrient uptake outer membrane protein [Reichenbachiella versicolor]